MTHHDRTNEDANNYLAFWLNKWTLATASDSNGYYIGVYAAFAVAVALGHFLATWAIYVVAARSASTSIHKSMLATLAKIPVSVMEKLKSKTINLFVSLYALPLAA